MTSFAVPAPRAATGGPSGFARLLGLVFWVVLPALAVLGIALGIATWTRHAHRQVPGIPGTFLVENRSCGGSICQLTGTFRSTDGQLVLPDLTGVAGWTQNSHHDVVYDPSTPNGIVPLATHWDPTAAITAISGGTLLIGAWGWLAFGARRTPLPGPAVA